jgi:hypothetical protein
MKNYERRKEKGKTEKGEKGKTPKWPVHSWALSGSRSMLHRSEQQIVVQGWVSIARCVHCGRDARSARFRGPAQQVRRPPQGVRERSVDTSSNSW